LQELPALGSVRRAGGFATGKQPTSSAWIRRSTLAAIASVLALLPADASSAITGRAALTDGSALRAVVDLPGAITPTPRESVTARLDNEGITPAALGREVRWLAVTESGSEIELDAASSGGREKLGPILLPPYATSWFQLTFPRKRSGRVVGYRLRRPDTPDLEIRAAWAGAAKRQGAALPLPPEGASEREPMEIGILVGADGKVEHFVPRSGAAALADSIAWALGEWQYDPAREDGHAVPSVDQFTLYLDQGLVARLRFAGAPDTVVPRVRAAVGREFSRVVERPQGDGLVVVGKPGGKGGAVGVPLFLVRWGPEPGHRATWVAIGAPGYGSVPGIACDMWFDQEDAPAAFARWLTDALGTVPLSQFAVVPSSVTAVPSGLPEAEGDADWGRSSLSHLARASVAAGADGPFSATWPQREAPRACAPPTATGDVLPPKIRRKVDPSWPRDGNTGRVIVQASIDETGAVREASLLKRGTSAMNRAALEAVCKWSFEPATVNGVPIPVPFVVAVNFLP
jgi:TonB family protein